MRRSLVDVLWVVALFVGAVVLIQWRYAPPEPLGSDAPVAQFSAARAREQLHSLVGDGRPHPVGSEASAIVREKLIARLRALGYTPEVQDTWSCSAIHTCARVRNVLALRRGAADSGPLVMISAHYESIPAGPGANDDGVGTAAMLEIARALTVDPPPRNGVLFLFNEGEEMGLNGAEAFCAEHPLKARVGAVVNLEARGSTGPSLMFETSDRNGRMLALYAEHVTRPATNSISYAIYKALPNDTDLTVFKREGLAGLNFAYVGGEVRYHTPLDRFENVDPRSLQHQGQNALAMVRALAGADLEHLRDDADAVFFDLLTLTTVHWPAAGSVLLALLAALLVGVAWLRAIRKGVLRSGEVLRGVIAGVAVVLFAAVGAAFTFGVLQVTGALPYIFSLARPTAARIAFVLVAFAASVLVARLSARRAGATGLWFGMAATWTLVAVVTSVFAPATSYPFALGAAFAGAAAILAPPRSGVLPRLTWMAPYLGALILIGPLAWLLYDGVGIFGMAASSVVVALLLAPVLPVWTPAPTGRLLVGIAVLWAVSVVAAIVSPRFTPDHPQKVNAEYHLVVDGAGQRKAQWVVTPMMGKAPKPMREALALPPERTHALPWPMLFKSHVAPAPVLETGPLPELRLLSVQELNGGLQVEAELASPRGALEAGLVFPAGRLRSATFNGKKFPEQRSKNLVPKLFAGEGWTNLISVTTGTTPVRLSLRFAGTDPVDAFVWDATPGVPPEGNALVAARPEWATPFQWGDRTFVAVQRRLAP